MSILVTGLMLSVACAWSKAPSRGSLVVHPVVFDSTGTKTARAKTVTALNEAFAKGGFKVLDETLASRAWRSKGYRTPTSMRPPTLAQLIGIGRSVHARYVCSAMISYHTRSIWVNLGPKTISNCNVFVTIADASTGKVAYESEGEGRSDEKSEGLKIALDILVTPLVSAVSGGPATPRETRAGQIAVARALNGFILVK